MAITKQIIIEEITERLGLNRTHAQDTLEELLEIIKSTLADGEDVMVSGFGKFQVNEKAPRRGRNPATGGEMLLDGRRIVVFKCSGKLRNMINGEAN